MKTFVLKKHHFCHCKGQKIRTIYRFAPNGSMRLVRQCTGCNKKHNNRVKVLIYKF